MKYINDNREKLNKEYSSFEIFKNSFIIDDILAKQLINFAIDKGLEINQSEFETSKKHIFINLKTLIARDLFNMSAAKQIACEIDSEYQKAIEVLNDKSIYKKMKINN